MGFRYVKLPEAIILLGANPQMNSQGVAANLRWIPVYLNVDMTVGKWFTTWNKHLSLAWSHKHMA